MKKRKWLRRILAVGAAALILITAMILPISAADTTWHECIPDLGEKKGFIEKWNSFYPNSAPDYVYAKRLDPVIYLENITKIVSSEMGLSKEFYVGTGVYKIGIERETGKLATDGGECHLWIYVNADVLLTDLTIEFRFHNITKGYYTTLTFGSIDYTQGDNWLTARYKVEQNGVVRYDYPLNVANRIDVFFGGFLSTVLPNNSGMVREDVSLIFDTFWPDTTERQVLVYPNAYRLGRINGYDEGYHTGYQEGFDEGDYEHGYADGTADLESVREGSYANGYYDGSNDGYGSGYDAGYADGYDYGYPLGFGEGQTETHNLMGSLKDMVFAIFDAPVTLINGMLDFDLFGINLLSLFKTILTAAVLGLITFVVIKLYFKFG